jgi:tyrosine-protein kinase Etk/Wzc
VVIATPPVLAVSDAAVAGRLADHVLMAVRWAETPRAAMRQAVARLRGFGLAPAGVVLTMTDPRREAAYADALGGYGYDAGAAAYVR